MHYGLQNSSRAMVLGEDMGRKNNKVRQLDGLGLDFDDMFGLDTSSPEPDIV